LVGLAKNTGKTETLATILAEHAEAGRRVGVTSIGRDGEEHDVIDARIAKPRILLVAGSIVATTGVLLRASGVAHERLAETGMRTPLGEVVVAELREQGAIEVAGPSVAADVRTVSDAMAGYGAEQVLIDGAIDRRAASSPAVTDGLVMATGAVLGDTIERVVALTEAAVELVRLPCRGDGGGEGIELSRGLVLGGDHLALAGWLQEHPHADTFTIDGALSEQFLQSLLSARGKGGREVRIVVGDPTKVFLSAHPPGWYRRQGIVIEVRHPIELKAITINPVAPQSHRFESEELRRGIEAAVHDVPVFDVFDERRRESPPSG
jgi:hypothetical protein